MATRNETHVHDLSTLANFKDWAQSISTALAAFGWTQTSDTGQVNWGSISSVPTSGNYVYEIWQPGDGGTAFYIRIDYGNNGGTSPAIRIQGGTGTNGSGTLTGFTTVTAQPAVTTNSGATLFNCLYCGDTSSFAIMLWRDASAGFNFVIAVDRSRTSAGATTNSYFTVMVSKTNLTGSMAMMQSVVFGVGAAPGQGTANQATNWSCICGAANFQNANQSMAFGGNVGISPVFPFIGYYDVPTLAVAHGALADFGELAVVSTSLLGATHTYIFSKSQNFTVNFGLGVLMRWE